MTPAGGPRPGEEERGRWRRRRSLSGGWRRWIPWLGDDDGRGGGEGHGEERGRWRRRKGAAGGRPGGGTWPRRIGLAVLLLAGLAAAALVVLWLTLPDPRPLASGWPETTAYVELRKAQAREEGRELDLRWSPVPLDRIPDEVERAVRVAEDAMFYRHRGIDWYEVWMSVREWWGGEERPRGASTITMQLARNLYLSPERSLLRKARETLLALRLERRLSKARILELYLNVVELGPGVFGVDAAARHYWGLPVSGLGRRQAAELAATLPAPLEDNPRTRTREFLWRTELIHRRSFGTAPPLGDTATADTAAPADTTVPGGLPGGPAPSDTGRPPLPGGPAKGTAGDSTQGAGT